MATVVRFLREWLAIPPPSNKPTYLLLEAMRRALRILLRLHQLRGSNPRTQEICQLVP